MENCLIFQQVAQNDGPVDSQPGFGKVYVHDPVLCHHTVPLTEGGTATEGFLSFSRSVGVKAWLHTGPSEMWLNEWSGLNVLLSSPKAGSA